MVAGDGGAAGVVGAWAEAEVAVDFAMKGLLAKS